MKRVLDKVWEPPWNIIRQVEEINKLISCCVVDITHVLREGNKIANHLASLTLEQNAIIQVASYCELDTQGRKITNSDKLQLPYIKVRKAKTTTQ